MSASEMIPVDSAIEKNELDTHQSPGFLIYAVSTAFFIFLSVSAIHDFPGRWGQISIVLAASAPLLYIICNQGIFSLEVLMDSKERFLLFALSLFSILNIYTSASRWDSLKGVFVFFITGVVAYLVTRNIFKSQENRRRFMIFLAAAFFCYVLTGFIDYALVSGGGRQIHALQSNPIPAGSILLLLMAGPWLVFSRTDGILPLLLIGFSMGLGFSLLMVIGERGPILAGMILLLVAIVWRWKAKGFVLALGGIIILASIVWLGKDILPKRYQEKLSNPDGIYLRLDAYSLAWSLFRQHPILGIGYNAEMKNSVPVDFEARFFTFQDRQSFVKYFERGNTFDNIILCLFVEGGSLFALTYLGFVGLVIGRSLRNGGILSKWPRDKLILLAVLLAFGFHSMTFDSLKYPALNWLFHSILGFLAATSAMPQAKNPNIIISPADFVV